eukprot:TRINITY_DN8864_c0_g1_i1.p1 TRINITY_DN8864_c0_g1~~TRINITY_DN8864_c0_g1_i1.p1  ORF type:complete len:161 (-),score=23.96 TRINITY_DN8864_c0_g1_i1:233-715(-)
MDGIAAFMEVEGYGTSGQPTAEQFKTIKQAGYEVVINIKANGDDQYAPEFKDLNEDKILSELDIIYVHIPVQWESPKIEDLEAFFKFLEIFEGKKIFIHCLKNLRVSAFVYLWRVLKRGQDTETSFKDVYKIWTPEDCIEDPGKIWVNFLSTAKTIYKSK